MTLKLQEVANFGMFFRVMQTIRFIHVCMIKIRTRVYTGSNVGEIQIRMLHLGGSASHISQSRDRGGNLQLMAYIASFTFSRGRWFSRASDVF